jgi:hypothetical protein
MREVYRKCGRPLIKLFVYTQVYVPYDCRSSKKRHQYAFTKLVFILFICYFGSKYKDCLINCK